MASYLISLYASRHPDPDRDTGKDVEAHRAYADQLTTEGVLGFVGVIVEPTATVTLGNTEDHAADAEQRSPLVGTYVVTADDRDEALAIAQRNPILEQGGYLEVRQIEG